MDRHVAFVLPIGLTLGGSNTWSVEMCRQLGVQHLPATLLEHKMVDWHGRLEVDLPSAIRRLSVPGPTAPEATAKDIPGFTEAYSRVLPGVIVPNYSWAAYAAVAELSRTRADEMRVVGVGHGHSSAYMDVLSYYESIIHLFIATNRGMLEELKRRLPHREEDIVCRSCPVNVPERTERNVAPLGQPLRMVYAGRITDYEKRVSNIVPLARALASRKVNFDMRIIGDGGYKDWLRHEISLLPADVAQRLHVEDMMRPEELVKVWSEADVTFLVSNSETSGLSLLEGMAHGCVPVSTACGGPTEYLEHGESGYLSPVDDMDTMAEHLHYLDKDRESLSRIGIAARKVVQAGYSYKEYTPWFLQQVDKIWKDTDRTWSAELQSFPPEAVPPKKKDVGYIRRLLTRIRSILEPPGNEDLLQ